MKLHSPRRDDEHSPQAMLDQGVLRANAIAWQKYTDTAVWAVVKSNGYGWGMETIVTALDDSVTGFCVADTDEFERLRTFSQRPCIILGPIANDRLCDSIARGAIPNITSPEGLDLAATLAAHSAAPVRIRLGLAPALSWFGIPANDVALFAEHALAPNLEVELWSHLTLPADHARERSAFAAFCTVFRNHGVNIVAQDIESTLPLTCAPPQGDRARIGIGLFGAYAKQVPGVSSAITLHAKSVTSQCADSSLRAGYAKHAVPENDTASVLRIGYGDGLPASLRQAECAAGKILSIGMQYTVISHAKDAFSRLDSDIFFELIGPADDIEAIVSTSQCSTHQLVLGLGSIYGARER